MEKGKPHWQCLHRSYYRVEKEMLIEHRHERNDKFIISDRNSCIESMYLRLTATKYVSMNVIYYRMQVKEKKKKHPTLCYTK